MVSGSSSEVKSCELYSKNNFEYSFFQVTNNYVAKSPLIPKTSTDQ